MTAEQTNPFRLKQWHDQAWRSLPRGREAFPHKQQEYPANREEGEEEKPTFFNSTFPILINFYPSNGFAQNVNHCISETAVTPIAHTNQQNFIEQIPAANANFPVLVNALVWKNIDLINNSFFCHLPFCQLVVGQGKVLLLSCDHTSHSGRFLQQGNDNFGVLRKPIALLTWTWESNPWSLLIWSIDFSVWVQF